MAGSGPATGRAADDPKAAEAPRYRAALLALARGTPEAALPLLEAAEAAGEGGGYAALNRGLALMQLGRLGEAAAALERAATALPGHPEPLFRLGTIAGLRGETGRAEALFLATLSRDPAHVTALAALAALEEAGGRHGAAAGLIARARQADPAEPELELAAARIALALGQAEAAAAGAAAVLAQRPAHAVAARLYAEALLARLPMEAALAEIAARAAADPFAAGWPLAAARLHGLAGQPAAALAELQTAELLAPDQPEILALLGGALAEVGRRQEAEPMLRAAIAARPTDAELRNRLATLYWRDGKSARMLRVLEDAVSEFGPQPALMMNRALALNAVGRQEEALASADAAVPEGGVLALVNRIAVLPYHPREGHAASLLACGRAIAAKLGGPAPLAAPRAAPLATPRPARNRDPGRRLRVGLLSGGFGRHPVGWLTIGGVENLPPEEFALYGYALKPREDMLSARFRACCAGWRDVQHAGDAEIAATIAADAIDILIDLGGYGESGRIFVLNHRPAPVQVKWVGAQFSTTGLPCVDWMLTDRWETPEGFERFYSERLLRLPDGYVCYAPPPYAPAVTPLPAASGQGVTFGCFNNLAKVTPAVLRCWARILAALPEARLELRTHVLGDAAAREALFARMAEAGLPPDRVRAAGGVPHRELLAAYGGIDIALDPFPYTGGLTACEALWMGVPVLTLVGDSFAGRHAFSHLSNIGLEGWAAFSEEDYVALAIARARDVAALAALRAGLRGKVAASPLADAPRFGRSLGQGLRRAWGEYCAKG
ncbi:O-linked N-acetylglucosamine transferase, SPINDLY family protein [Siccirubricoccus phaeus]|uniref:O-linked N-acetylglucosamine transferase, SPINDLY family protein n=1 Tax=Siccirubricoccus phaeus TaxID=2595053 RepID=UPI00165AE7A6|nr:tetratricopeptide repeat protein [Siccirubricoccus phaeus]